MLSHPLLRFTRCIDYCTRYVLPHCLDKKRLKFLDNKFMLCCIHTSNLRVHTSIFTVYEKKLVKVSVRKNFGVVKNSFGQFHSTFIKKVLKKNYCLYISFSSSNSEHPILRIPNILFVYFLSILSR